MEFITNAGHLFLQGGLVMWPLLICSIIAITILIERVRMYNSAKSDMDTLKAKVAELVPQGKWKELRQVCEEDGGVAAELVETAASQPHDVNKQTQALQGAAGAIAARLRAHLNYLETIVTLAPLLGLLGTVTGMIGSFSVLSVSDGEPFAITGGVGEALIATATGLCVAIIALVIHAYLVQREDSLVSEMEEVGAVYMTALVGDNDAA
ncbi:MotA/TolQ/ExbB proton channel family protein [Veillonella caviae]|uniref:MotA/TolQ/ExbB proton channel family protein n=1 Tax=Veillonella caviae TaxID=248316 RepID=UPI0023A8902B|nr:MotA/TolQ/ExbB proton channel family protein [Veillonella caviae]MCI5709389.1 MotA/TolQ/ExbB proton channel family protein [Veillonella caviae]MCI6407852.1 MotA/TolQ/ExbB proton channel family protein [Veillonella caviae]MDY4746324.1 MotA/TolQ/ExbB proton channel family protein [Veillonella caviae]MDY5715569.1 MotA/TolQ/ExbB proton channel family protein [Veillonella caviae]MDY6225062.1 MotA/TolQ/ExbB proton channel family protein [Veillonella caviae]